MVVCRWDGGCSDDDDDEREQVNGSCIQEYVEVIITVECWIKVHQTV